MSIYGGLIISLQQIINQFNKRSDIDYTIAKYLLNNLYQDNLSINKISEDCHISTASVTRFSQNLGYQGFTELKKDYDLLKSEKHEMEIDFFKTDKANYLSHSKEETSLTSEFHLVANEIEKFIDNFDIELIEKLSQLIYESNKIGLYATSIPGNISLILQNTLLTVGKFIECYPTTLQQFESAKQLTKNDLAIFISLEGSHVMNRDLTLAVTDSEATSVLITHNPEMKLGSLFDYIIPLGDHGITRSGKYKLLIFIEYLTHFYFVNYS